ncbi:MAG: GDSL-type esterase/lipase family protein [Myxococcota bacterium]
MKRITRFAAWTLAGLVVLGAWPAYRLVDEIRKAASQDPLAWEDDIAALEDETRALMDARGVVFIGSSSIRLWSTLERDMEPFTVVQHGFGGAKLADVLHYADRLVVAYAPLAVVVFVGTNDIDRSSTKTPESLLATYQSFVARIREGLPNVPIYYIGITPTPLRWGVWPQVQQTNALIRSWSEQNPSLFYIETGTALLGDDGEPDRDNYRFDTLHLSARGYEIWTQIIRTRLVEDLETNS